MAIKNTTKNTVIGADFRLCTDNASKSIGLMFSKRQKASLIFKFDEEKIISLHMFFVFYPIDIIFLDRKNSVVCTKENFKPFTFCNSRKKAMYAIEAPKGAVKKSKTEIGDKIDF